MKIHPKPTNEYNPKKRLGYVHVYTGSGKGKTTAALGVVLRAAGQGHKVTMLQFLKGAKDSGELIAATKLGDNVEIIQFGRADLTDLDNLQAVDGYLASQGLQYARDIMRYNRRRPDVLILDELTTAIAYGLLRIEDIVDFLDNRYQNMEIIITGEDAHPALLNLADLVTIMQSTKQYFDYDNFAPRLGIEH